jgi:hypothetical protein
MARIRVSSLSLALLLSLVPSPSFGTFHLMKIVEVFPGTVEQPEAQYVMLQMYFPFQNFVAGHGVKLFDAIGNPVVADAAATRRIRPGSRSGRASRARITSSANSMTPSSRGRRTGRLNAAKPRRGNALAAVRSPAST